MNLPHSPRSGSALLLSLIAAAGLSATSLFGQSVTTAPVGAVTKTIPVGLTAVGITLLNPDLVVASCTANTANVITLSGVSNAGALLTSGLPYYIEAVSGPLEGERFDVDVGATIGTANGTVTIQTTSANNTFSLASDNAIGSQFALRKHVTLAQIQSSFTSALVANNQAALADQIQLLNPQGNGFITHYLRSTPANEWRITGTTTVTTNLPIPPGVGIFFKKNTTPATLTMTGGVRVNDFAFPMPVGLSLRANGYPISYSPSSLGGTVANGWTANNQFALADQLQILNGAGNGFTTYFLRSTGTPAGTEWRITGTTTVVTNDSLLTYDSAYIVSRKAADTDYILVGPTL